MKKRVKILLTMLFISMLPYVADACSGAVYTGGDVTLKRIIADANLNCSSGDRFAVFDMDGNAFSVVVE